MTAQHCTQTQYTGHSSAIMHNFSQCQNTSFNLVANPQHKSMNKSMKFIKLKSHGSNCSCLVTKKTKARSRSPLSLQLDWKKKSWDTYRQTGFCINEPRCSSGDNETADTLISLFSHWFKSYFWKPQVFCWLLLNPSARTKHFKHSVNHPQCLFKARITLLKYGFYRWTFQLACCSLRWLKHRFNDIFSVRES